MNKTFKDITNDDIKASEVKILVLDTFSKAMVDGTDMANAASLFLQRLKEL